MINVRKKYLNFTVLVTAGLLVTSTNLFAAMTAKQIVDKMKVNNAAAEYQKGTIIAVKGKRKKKRVFVVYMRKFPNGASKSLFAIMQPSSLRGTAILSITKSGGAKRKYLFLPSTKKLTLLGGLGGGSDPGKGILGTDFAPGDLSFGNVSWSNAKVLKDSVVSGQSCYVIKVNNPRASKKALYNKRIVYISKKQLLPLKVRMMKGKKTVKLIKVFKVKRIKNVYRVTKMAIGNMRKKTKTIVMMTSIKIGKGSFSDSVFSKRSVKSMKYLK